jgi:hypothetical protein
LVVFTLPARGDDRSYEPSILGCGAVWAGVGVAVAGGVSEIEDDVRELVRRRGLDPMSARAAVSRLAAEVIADYDERWRRPRLGPRADRPFRGANCVVAKAQVTTVCLARVRSRTA